MIYDDMRKRLNPRSGIVQLDIVHDESESSILFDITWKGDIHFIVSGRTHFGWYYVVRNKQLISATYSFRKLDDSIYRCMQNIIDEIENGKYRSKKTLSEKIDSIVESRKLTSYMNNTKWHEFVNAIKEQMIDIPIKYKTLLDDNDPEYYWTIGGDEYFDYMNMTVIEWFKIACIIKESEYRGRLLNPLITSYDKEEELLQIFKKYNIPYEYDEIEKAFIIYGYK